MGERYRANALADKVNREGHLEESLHRTRMEIQLLKSEVKNAMSTSTVFHNQRLLNNPSIYILTHRDEFPPWSRLIQRVQRPLEYRKHEKETGESLHLILRGK